ncbi:MAG: hypothetical protein MJZ06_09875 [Bacteroidaceae bacterium]|nr:hypothetical protein [Bacteroidaceae bacterium]
MTLYEILNFNKEMLLKLQSFGAKIEHCRYIELYDDYTRMYEHGEKVTYIVSVLASKYNICERKAYAIIKLLGKHCTNNAVP